MKLPPIEYFYGRTPMAIWISKCKPFEPKGIGKSIIWIEVKGNELTEKYKLYLKALEAEEKHLKEQMNKYFNIRP